MGNIVAIKDKDGNELGRGDFSILCASYVFRIAAKYNPAFESFVGIDRIDQEFEIFYSKASPEDEIVALVFMNDKSVFTEEHIPHFQKAIEVYPEGFAEGPKRVLVKLLGLLVEHREIHTEFLHTTAAVTIRKEG